MNISQIIAGELNAKPAQVQAAIALLDEGATVPFIARYRKEKTGALDDGQLRLLAKRLDYLRELVARKTVVLKSIEEQGKLTPELAAQIDICDNKTALEDLYLPYKPKRHSKAKIARENGLQPLAQQLLNHPESDPNLAAQSFINENVSDAKVALDGARAILIEQFAEDAELIGQLRDKLWREAEFRVRVVEGKQIEGEKFKDYFDYRESLTKIPSHRILAMLRGRNEGALNLNIDCQSDEVPGNNLFSYEKIIAQRFGVNDCDRAADKWLNDTVCLAWRNKIFSSLESNALAKLKEQADNDAINVFAKNLKDLLLAAPAGRLSTLGLDPGFRTGIKVAAIDDTGKLLDTAVVYLHQEKQALSILSDLIKKHHIRLVAIGNGTASRETDKLVGELLQLLPEMKIHKIMVSEAGASVYSASELAAAEFPELDVSLRGAVSIARRLQDPLAELVKIDPKSIGVGQYQHDVNQIALAKTLDAVVEDCVNAVGVDVNTASAALLARISGLNATLAKNIVDYRDKHGAFQNRKDLLKVPRLGEKTYEQAAGFLRVLDGSEPLDASAVHPEAYPVVAKMLAKLGITAQELIGNRCQIAQIRAVDFVDENFGLPTIMDILTELEKPNRDPRGEFKVARFADGVNQISDLRVGMILEGVVSNVANFGAFVDVGVHQDGLVHISALADYYVSNPLDVVNIGDVVRVKVLEVDVDRKRISLSMRLDDDNVDFNDNRKAGYVRRHEKSKQILPKTAIADAFARLKR